MNNNRIKQTIQDVILYHTNDLNVTQYAYEIPLYLYDKMGGTMFITSKQRNLPVWQIGNRIGSPSAYGSVYSMNINTNKLKSSTIDNNLRSVVKYMTFNDQTDKNIFDNEIDIGSLQGIGKSGVKIYLWYKTATYGFYIMDHVTQGNKNVNFESLYTYLRHHRDYFSINVDYGNKFIKILKNTLLSFYKLGIYHGDLHSNNIMVIFNHDNLYVKFKIVDYGSVRKIRLPNCPIKKTNTLAKTLQKIKFAHEILPTPMNVQHANNNGTRLGSDLLHFHKININKFNNI